MPSPLEVEHVSPAYWRVILNNPPINLFTPEMRVAFGDLMDELDANPDIKVVVFDSANPRYFISHVDVANRGQLQDTPGPTGLPTWPDFTVRIGMAAFLTVASIRGRARGVGSELLQALDVRFASRETAILAQPEIGFGFIPGGGGMERLWRLTGKARALEIIVSGDDYDATTAELYGWINRAVPDADLDRFVDRFARRVETFDRQAISAIKSMLNDYTGTAMPEQLLAGYEKFLALFTSPQAQARVKRLMELGLQTDGDLELNMAEHLIAAP